MHQAENATDHGIGHVERHMPLGIGTAIGKQCQRPGREAKPEDTREIDRSLQLPNGPFVRHDPVAGPPPNPDADEATRVEDTGQIQAEKKGCTVIMRQRKGDCIGEERKVEQRNLL